MEEHVRADDRHVGNHRLAQQPRDLRHSQDQLPLHALAAAVIEAALGDEVLHVAAPSLQRVLQPEEIAEAAEADVKPLRRDVHRDRLDGDLRVRLGDFQRRRSDRRGQGLIGCEREVRQPEDAVLLEGQEDRFGRQRHAQLALQLGVARFDLPLARQPQVEPPRQGAGEVVLDHRRIIGLSLELAAEGVVAPPGLQQTAVQHRLAPRNRLQGIRLAGFQGHRKGFVAAKEEVDCQPRRLGGQEAANQSARLLADRPARGQRRPRAEHFAKQAAEHRIAHRRIEHAAVFFRQAEAVRP